VSELNQYAISRVLGSKMTPVMEARFGGFGVLETTAESLRARQASQRGSPPPHFSYDEDRLVVKAFEDVRDGAAPDAILWDKGLARAFARRCRELGLQASDAFLNRRLLSIRKNIKRYNKHGITIKPSTKSQSHPSIVPQSAHVIEFALVRLRYRYGASIDDILIDPTLADQFEGLASKIAPGLSSEDLRLGALYIRKTRYLARSDLPRIQSLDVRVVERALSEPVSLVELKVADVPLSPGLIELKEGDKYLYVSRNEELRPTAKQFQSGKAFELVANGFWKPDLEAITLQYAPGDKIEGVGTGLWERRLIHDRDPVFNWPVHQKES
jgi:site-specific DNA-methyltransferase (adenine-specific)